eukprot:CAMPEP_0198328178 /NCGR_PEP_ID=MMETSP1450-20131203/15281_1 /TAXON_ID=753684 ORGANISM="Madagascaria erythrocladiodes, Strain CCMP3234" /NCGR_SAMPLE_ID=MMETSP1450 /ASSEMBLY_ACC=CAM_ASM_001115 /LENGTH=353 /DNA_ID=CAMNT_0044032283 /DNA_START=146 /DNA_END=1207 /DNA_ORIENTATION=-
MTSSREGSSLFREYDGEARNPCGSTDSLAAGGFRRSGLAVNLRPDEEAEQLHQLALECKSKGRPDLEQNYRPEHLADLVQQFRVSDLVKHFLAAEQELKRVQDLYKNFHPKHVDRIFNSMLSAVRGRDRRGAPIVWYNSALKPNELEGNADLIMAHWSIICRHGMAMRPPGVSYMIIVSDERRRRPLQFQTDELIALVRHDLKLFLPNLVSDCVYIVGGGWGTSTIVSILNRIAPAASFRAIQPEDLLDIVSNPSDIPSYFELRGVGTTLERNEATLSAYEEEIFGEKKQSMRDWCNRQKPVEEVDHGLSTTGLTSSPCYRESHVTLRGPCLGWSDDSNSCAASTDWADEQLM